VTLDQLNFKQTNPMGVNTMADISAMAVKALRDRTGLSMMDCKRALQEAGGDADKAIEHLRKEGKKTEEKRSGRATSSGRIAVVADFGKVGAMVDLRCESAPVAKTAEFVQLANDMVQQLATGPGAATPAELLAQPSPSKPGTTLQHEFDELLNRIREAFKLERIVRIDGTCAGYAHHNGAVGVLLHVEGGTPELARDICMQIAAMRPLVLLKEELDPALVSKERELAEEVVTKEAEAMRAEATRILALPDEQMQDPNNLERVISSHTRATGDLKKAEGLIKNKAKVVEGRMNVFYTDRCLLMQPHANREKYAGKTIADLAKAAGMKIVRFVHWELPKE
jgi:elongation factor Ts